MATRRRQVVVIDDDEGSLAGAVSLLAEADDLEVEGLTPSVALARPSWEGVDVAVVDATDRRHQDHFVGVSVVEAIRRHRSPQETAIIVITGFSWLDALRVRMREARADLFFDRMEVQTGEALRQVVRDPEGFRGRAVPGPADPEATYRLGITDRTRVNEALRAADHLGWDDGTLTRRGRRSRAENAQKRRWSAQARLAPRNTDGRVPDRAQADPSWPQIAGFLDWARRVPKPLRRLPDDDR